MKRRDIDYGKATEALYGEPKPIKSHLPTDSHPHHKRAFWAGLKAQRHDVTPDDARELFEQIHPILPELAQIRLYVVYCHILNIPISPESASDFARSESERDKTATDMAKGIEAIVGEIAEDGGKL